MVALEGRVPLLEVVMNYPIRKSNHDFKQC